MVALQPGAPPKPQKRPKSPPTGLRRGGAKPRESGRRYEASLRDATIARYEEDYPGMVAMERVIGSGAFGKVDATLKGDLRLGIGPERREDAKRLRALLEAKTWDQVDGRGEKTVTFSLSLIDKIIEEAAVLNRVPGFVYHPKNTSRHILCIDYFYVLDILVDQEAQITALTEQLEEALDHLGAAPTAVEDR